MSRYDAIGTNYRNYRVPDARWAAALDAALGDARTVVNVGAGAGSYEPERREVIAVEPSRTMLLQRRTRNGAVQAIAEQLPFRDDQFDAAMAILTIHHWTDWRAGLRELDRVAPMSVILTWDPDHPGFWLTRDYFPEFLEVDRAIFPKLRDLGGTATPLPVPADCTDGCLGAYWKRPAAYLDPGVRGAISSFAGIDDADPRLLRLARELDTIEVPEGDALDLGYRVIVRRRDSLL